MRLISVFFAFLPVFCYAETVSIPSSFERIPAGNRHYYAANDLAGRLDIPAHILDVAVGTNGYRAISATLSICYRSAIGLWGNHGARTLFGSTVGSVRDLWAATPVEAWRTNTGTIGGVSDFGIIVAVVGDRSGANPPIYQSPCISVIDPTVHCSFNGESIVLDHGVTDGAPSSAEASVVVSCNYDTTAIMTLASGGDTIRIGGGLARISSSHGALGRPFALQSGRNVLRFSSRLEGAQPGAWESTSVLVVSMY